MKRIALLVIAGLAISGTALADAPEQANQNKYAVMPFSVARGIDAEAVKLLDDTLLTELSQISSGRFLGSSDISAIIGLEQQRQMLDCSDESCMAEIGNALGVDLLVSASLGKVGDRFVINAKLIDPEAVRVVRREKIVVDGNEGALLEAMPELARLIVADEKTAVDQQTAASPGEAGTRTVTGSGTSSGVATTASTGTSSDAVQVADGQEGMSPLGWAGVGLVGVGATLLIGGGVGVMVADSVLGDPASTGKESALTGYGLGLGGLAVGTLLAAGGVVLLVVGL